MNSSVVMRGLIAGVVVAVGVLVGPAVASAEMPSTTPAAGCARIVELQPLQFPTTSGHRQSAALAAAMLPDDGGASAPTASVVEDRAAGFETLDLVINTGAAVKVRTLYVAPSGCAIAWSHDVHTVADPEGRRSVHIPAFTVRLVQLSVAACPACLRAV